MQGEDVNIDVGQIIANIGSAAFSGVENFILKYASVINAEGGEILNGYNSLPKQGVKGDFEIDWITWLPIVKGYATLNDLRTVYDFEDGIAMHEVIIELLNEERRALEKQ